MSERDLYYQQAVIIEGNSGDKNLGFRGAGPLANVVDATVRQRVRQTTRVLPTRENFPMRFARKVGATGVRAVPTDVVRFAPRQRIGVR